MSRLSRVDLLLLLDAARKLGEQCALDSFPSTTMQVVKSLISGISYSFNEIDLERDQATGIMDPFDSMPSPALVSVMESVISQHPLITRFASSGDGSAAYISDFLDPHTYHGLELYADFYRFLDTEDQVAIQLQSPSRHVIGVIVNRDRRTFTERDRDVLNALRPFVMHGFRNAEILTTFHDSNHASYQQAIWIGANRVISHATSGSQTLLDAYFGSERVAGIGLPRVLLDWVRQQAQLYDPVDNLQIRSPLRVPGPNGTLSIRFLAGTDGAADLLLLNERRTSLSDQTIASLGLSSRQADVVRLVVQGKTSSEIGELLGIASRTVEKHIETIYEKLGVNTRAALVARVLHASDQS